MNIMFLDALVLMAWFMISNALEYYYLARHHLGLSLMKKARNRAMKPPRLLRNTSSLQLPDVSESRHNNAMMETYNAPRG